MDEPQNSEGEATTEFPKRLYATIAGMKSVVSVVRRNEDGSLWVYDELTRRNWRIEKWEVICEQTHFSDVMKTKGTCKVELGDKKKRSLVSVKQKEKLLKMLELLVKEDAALKLKAAQENTLETQDDEQT
jgi:D-mannonate dehydratase